MDTSHHSTHVILSVEVEPLLHLGIPSILIKKQFDWRSNAFERYTIANNDTKLKVTKSFALALS